MLALLSDELNDIPILLCINRVLRAPILPCSHLHPIFAEELQEGGTPPFPDHLISWPVAKEDGNPIEIAAEQAQESLGLWKGGEERDDATESAIVGQAGKEGHGGALGEASNKDALIGDSSIPHLILDQAPDTSLAGQQALSIRSSGALVPNKGEPAAAELASHVHETGAGWEDDLEAWDEFGDYLQAFDVEAAFFGPAMEEDEGVLVGGAGLNNIHSLQHDYKGALPAKQQDAL